MSAIESVFTEFEENSITEGTLIQKTVRPKEFKIRVQCPENNMPLCYERCRLYETCRKHRIDWILCPWDINFQITESKSIKPMYDSLYTFPFFFKKRFFFL